MTAEPGFSRDARLALRGKQRPGWVLLVFNLCFWPYLLLSCAVLFWPSLLIFLVTVAWDRHLRLLHRFTSAWGAHYLVSAPMVQTRVDGKEHLVPGETYVFVSNHQSMVDILAVFATGLDYKWVSKVENFFAPFIGWTMALNGYIPLKRGHLPSILRMFRRCERALKKGDSVFVFPEGTRSPDGNIQSFFRGAFLLSVRSKAKVVPVILEGTAQVLPKSSVQITPYPVSIRILPPVDPAEVGFDSRKLRDLVREKMIVEQDAMRGR